MSILDSMRLAMPVEAADIARFQWKSRSRQSGMATALAAIPVDQVVRTWHEAIAEPSLVHCRVLVALSQGRVVGFVVTGPNNDPDAEVTDGMVAEFVTDADVLDDHASRLVSATVDMLRADGYETATWWIHNDDDALRGLLIECGWVADGAHRSLGTEDRTETARQIRSMTRATDQGPATDAGRFTGPFQRPMIILIPSVRPG